jgi:hypothetical protein
VRLLTKDGNDETSSAALATIKLVAQVVGDMWQLEGSAMVETIARLGNGDDRTAAVGTLLDALQVIAERAQAARIALERLASS